MAGSSSSYLSTDKMSTLDRISSDVLKARYATPVFLTKVAADLDRFDFKTCFIGSIKQ